MKPNPGTAKREALVSKALACGPATLYELAATLGQPDIRVRYTLNAMREAGKAHICAWVRARSEKRPKALIPQYKLGAGVDMPCPPGKKMGRRQMSVLDFDTGSHLTQLSVLWIKT